MALYYCYECDMRLNEDEIPAHEHPRKNDELCCSECYMMLQERAEDEIYDTALGLAKGYLPIFMELAYLCRARRIEIAALKFGDELEDGLRLERTKGSEGEITAWTPRLRAAVEAAKAFNQDAPSPISGGYLIHDKHGAPIKKNAFDSAWRRLMDKVETKGIERFTFHDLKARGITRHKTNFGGHRDTSGKMRKTYVRDLQIVEATE